MLKNEIDSLLRKIIKAYLQLGVCIINSEQKLYCSYCWLPRETCERFALAKPIQLLGGYWDTSKKCYVLGQYEIYITGKGFEIHGPNWEPHKWDEEE